MAPEPEDERLNLNVESDAVRLSLYRKVVFSETFGPQAMKSAKLDWLFSLVHQACQPGSTFISRPVMEELLNIAFYALVHAAENGPRWTLITLIEL